LESRETFFERQQQELEAGKAARRGTGFLKNQS